MSSPITSVSASQTPIFSSAISLSGSEQNVLISLSVRGTDFELQREELTSLPESILLCLFPNGLMLEDQNEVRVHVDFDPETLSYVLNYFRDALDNPPPVPIQNPALVHGKAAIIVLKEDLDFYIIPSKGTPPAEILSLRQEAGRHLVSNDSIFDGLRKQTTQGGSAEQHLIDMLCASGFHADDVWARRTMEPHRACITSLVLALLKPVDAGNAVATSQKLLLFWRKPARKCWWDALTLPTGSATTAGAAAQDTRPVKIWARRVWTLELSIIGQ